MSVWKKNFRRRVRQNESYDRILLLREWLHFYCGLLVSLLGQYLPVFYIYHPFHSLMLLTFPLFSCWIIQKQHVNRLVFCINFTSNRFEEYEASIIATLRKNNPNMKVVIVLTQCYNTKSKDFERMVTYIKSKTNYATIVPVLCVDWETDGGIKKSFGVNDVMSEVFNE